MTIDRKYGGIVHFVCDRCDDEFNSAIADFANAWAEAKRLGWKVKKDETGWSHTCPSCS